MNSNRIRQPFDFANRTGNIVFDVDAKTEGPHSFWTEVWITDEPVQGPHTDHPGTHSYPRNGVGFIFDGDWCGGALQSGERVARDRHVHELPADDALDREPLLQDRRRHGEPLPDPDQPVAHHRCMASDAGGTNFRQISSTNIPLSLHARLPVVPARAVQRGEVQLDRHDDVPLARHRLRRPGHRTRPRLRDPRRAARSVRRHRTTSATRSRRRRSSCPNVDLTDVKQAYLTYSTWFFAGPKSVTATINGVARTCADPNPDAPNAGGYQWRYMMQPVALSDLQAGHEHRQLQRELRLATSARRSPTSTSSSS